MPYAYNVYTGNGSATQYTIGFPYIRKEHVKVFVNYVDTTFTFANDTTAQLSSAPANGVRVEVRRVTPADNVLVDYTDGSTLTAADLDTNALQQLYLDQELDDAQKQVVTISSTTGLPTLGNQRLTNVSDPTGAQDAATKNYVDTNFQPVDAELTELATMSSGTASALADLTQAETQILDGATVTTAELNTLDGITASTAELNKLDGVTADTAELNKLDGVTASTAELNILDGVTATAAEINKLDGVTASTSELNTLDGVTATAAEINKLDGVTATTAELNFVDGVTSAIQNQIDGKQPLDSELTELSTMQSGTASALADLTQAEVQVLDGATLSTAELNKLDGVTSTTNELNILDGVTATTTELNVTDGLTASTSELNQLDGKTISSTLTPANTNDIPTSSAVNTFVSGLLNALGGFVAISDETSFPTTNPDPSDNAGTVVSIADAGGIVVDAAGASTTGRTTGNVTVTITGFPTSLRSSTLAAGLGLQVQTTSTLNTYTYHKLIAKETDITQLSDDINDFNARYRVSANAPTTDLDAGDLWFDTTAGKMKVYDANDSAWEEVQSVGNFFINTLSSSSGTGGGSATFNDNAYRFTLSNAGTTAQQMLVSVNGVIQKPNSGTSQPSEGFAIDTNDIIFAAPPATGASYFIVTIGSTVNIGQPSNNTVDTSELVDGAVTNAKVSSSAAIAGTKINPDFGTQTIVTTGSLGVGTSPGQKLHVVGNAAITGSVGVGTTSASFSSFGSNTGGIHIKDVGSSSNALKLESGSNLFHIAAGASKNYIFGSTSHPLGISTNGTERLSITADGLVGIGSSSPNATLEVSSAGTCTLNIVSDNDNSGTNNDSLINFRVDANNNTPVAALGYDQSEGNFVFFTNGTRALRIDSSQRVMIGTTTEGNASADNLTVASSGETGITIRSGSSSNGNIYFSDATFGDAEYKGIVAYEHPGNAMSFSTDSVERMRIDSSGRVLVGATSSRTAGGINCHLHVEGTGANGSSLTLIRNTNGATNPPYLFFGKTRSGSIGGTTAVQNGDLLGYLGWQGADGNDLDGTAAAIQATIDNTPGSNDMPGRLEFLTTRDGNNSPVIAMVINHKGELRLGYGNSDPISTDHAHSIGDPGLDQVTTNLARFVMQEKSGDWISFKDGSGNHYGTIGRNGSGVSYGSNSDYRLKNNVQNFTGGITLVKQLRPVTFNWNELSGNADTTSTQRGFLAHEVQAVEPAAVTGNKDEMDRYGDCFDAEGIKTQTNVFEHQAKEGETWTFQSEGIRDQQLDPAKLVPILTAALQEAIAKIETLETQNASLEARLTALEGAS